MKSFDNTDKIAPVPVDFMGDAVRGVKNLACDVARSHKANNPVTQHITIGFYMTFWQMICMMIKFIFASFIASVIVMMMVSVMAPMFVAIILGIMKAAMQSHGG